MPTKTTSTKSQIREFYEAVDSLLIKAAKEVKAVQEGKETEEFPKIAQWLGNSMKKLVTPEVKAAVISAQEQLNQKLSEIAEEVGNSKGDAANEDDFMAAIKSSTKLTADERFILKVSERQNLLSGYMGFFDQLDQLQAALTQALAEKPKAKEMLRSEFPDA